MPTILKEIMKIKLTKNDNFKVTMNEFEVAVITSIFSHVRLGMGEESDVILEWLENFSELINEVPVSFTYDEDEGHAINV